MNAKINLIVLLALAFYSFAQAQEATVTITLIVDTNLLGDDRNNPGGCTFTVVPVDRIIINDPLNPKTFTIQVDESDDIVWQGITTTGEDVKIKRITFLRGTNIFDSDVVKGRNTNGKEKVKAKPNKQTPKDKDFEYGIRFKTGLFSTYEIDPKIKVGNQ